MTPTVLTLLAVLVGLGIVIGLVLAVRSARSRPGPEPDDPLRRVHQECVAGGHSYQALDTGYRCATCGNHVSSREGELYGLAADGRRERRREHR